MTRDEIAIDLSAYAAGLEAELTLLRQIQKVSDGQREATVAGDAEQMKQIADERERLMAGLVRVEHEIRASRAHLAEHQSVAAELPGFPEVVEAHRTAGSLVNRILLSDRDTVLALREAEVARRQASQSVEAGEATLAAYRRVITPALTSPSLLNRRG